MGDLRLRCVKVSGQSEVQDVLNQAFKVFVDQEFTPVWFSQDDCLKVSEKEKNTIYIFDLFEGEAFDHIAGLGCRILGPMSILTSVALNKNIPRTSAPLYNMAMKDVIVCCTNLERETREKLLKLVEWMGGKTMKDFTEDVTHLVAGVVGSKKYQVAAEMGKQLMLPKWVDVVWEKSKFEAAHGMDEQFQEYKCPVFAGCVVTVSGLGSGERQEVKKLVERGGGEYSGEMRVKETTHLIINEPKGQKYQFALKWALKVVRSEWMYESIEKGYCQDEAKYEVKSPSTDQPTQSGMKTSTPERKSMAGGMNDLSNISAISMVAIEESRMGNLTTLTATRLEDPDPLEALDMSKMPTEMFLDGCKIFLSGFRGATLDKLRKIINIGGATRCNQINDNVTHVVIGDRINSDIDHIKALGTRPHTVTINWLVECYKQEEHVEETNYYSSELPAPESSSSPQLKKPNRKSRAPKQSVAELPPPPPTTAAIREGANEDDMHEIMSQYMNADTTKDDEETIAPQNGMEVDDDDPTQDPDATTGTQVEGGVFSSRTFMLFGFEEEHLPVLTSFIKENGGKVLQLNVRGIPDYAIVPIDGYPVDKTVNSIVTNVWLQMCIEQNQLLPERSNALFMPLEIQVDKLPLKDCVISISGYTGVERDCLMRIADILGARTQEYFVRKAKEGLLPSTHLVVNAPEGSKYDAAVKWKIPAVTKSWILACARTGNREKEDHYLTVNGDQNESRLVEPPERTVEAINQKNQSNIQTNQSKHSLQNEDQSRTAAQLENEKINTNVSSKSDQNNGTVRANRTATTEGDYQEFSTMGDTEALMCEMSTTSNAKGGDTANSDMHNKGSDTVHKSRTETITTANDEFSEMGDTEAMIQELSTVEHGRSNRTRNSDKDASISKSATSVNRASANVQEEEEEMDTGTPTVTMKPRQSLGRKHVLEKQSASQKENVSGSGRSTPVQNRVRELQQTDQPTNQSEKVTPSKFLNPNKKFNPNFNVEELLAEIHTPEDIRAKKAKRRDSLPLEELFSLKLEEARQKIAKDSELKRQQKDQERVMSQQTDEPDGDADMDAASLILCGVVISVSKKLAKDQSELNDLVSSLGGDYRWSYDNSCTHFIFQGRANDTSKEFRMARNQKNLQIVSPHWLYKCKEQNEKVDESLYPHTYNPNLSLSVVSSKRTPLRTPVRSRRLRDRANSNKEVVNVDNTEEQNQASSRLADQNQASSRLADHDKGDISNKTGAKGDNTSDSAGKDGGQRELRSSDKSGSDEEKRVPDQHCEVGSLEMREVLSKQLENVMAEPLDRKRRKSKRLNNSGQVGTPEDTARQTRRTQDDIKNTSGRTSRGASGKEEKLPGEMSQSQSVQVVWADPVGRLEQEKLAEKLERACSPTQEVDTGDHIGLEIPQDAQFSDTDPEPEPEDPPFSNQGTEATKTTPRITKQISDRTPTPEGPPLAFPTMKTKKITPPRPVELIEEQPPTRTREPPVFILSGMQQAEKDDYGALVEQLGGKILEVVQFDCRCTHLVISSVSRNEKFLASIASGKWVLHKSYFEACRQEQRFVEEDVYEWGSEGTLSLVKNMESNVRHLAAAARQWRIQIQDQKKTSPEKSGAFCQWNVILCCDKNKEGSYKRLLEAGGATVTSQRPPFTSGVNATHVLLEPHKVPLSQEDFEALLSSGCLCLRPDFISAHLSDPQSDVNDYYPAEIVALKAALSDTPKKRKASSGQTASKRSRRR